MALVQELLIRYKTDSSAAVRGFRQVNQASNQTRQTVQQNAQQAQRTSEKAWKAMGNAAKVAGVAAGAALTASVMEGMEREKSSDKLSAALGLGPEEAKRMASVSADIYKGAWGESTEEVNQALKQVMLNVGGMKNATNADLQSITTKTMDLATTFDQDLAGTTRAVGQMMKTGMAKDANEALDLITVGMQSGANKADDMMDTMNEYGTQFRKMGIDGSTAMGLLSQGIAGGARDADLVADSIKEFSIRAIDGSKATVQGFTALGLSAKDMQAKFAKGGPAASAGLGEVMDKLRAVEDPAKRSAIAVKLFGTQAEDMGEALFALDPSKAVASMGQVGGASQQLSDTLNDNAATQIEGYKRSIQDMGLKIVESTGTFGLHPGH